MAIQLRPALPPFPLSPLFWLFLCLFEGSLVSLKGGLLPLVLGRSFPSFVNIGVLLILTLFRLFLLDSPLLVFQHELAVSLVLEGEIVDGDRRMFIFGVTALSVAVLLRVALFLPVSGTTRKTGHAGMADGRLVVAVGAHRGQFK